MQQDQANFITHDQLQKIRQQFLDQIERLNCDRDGMVVELKDRIKELTISLQTERKLNEKVQFDMNEKNAEMQEKLKIIT